MQAEGLDEARLADAGRAGQADAERGLGAARRRRRGAPRAAARWSARVEFDQRDRPGQGAAVAGGERGRAPSRRHCVVPSRKLHLPVGFPPLASPRLFGIPARAVPCELDPRCRRDADRSPALLLAVADLAPSRAARRARPTEAATSTSVCGDPRRHDDAGHRPADGDRYTAPQPDRDRRHRRDLRRLLLRRPAPRAASTADGTVVPRRYEATSKSPRALRRTAIDWKNGAAGQASRSIRREHCARSGEAGGDARSGLGGLRGCCADGAGGRRLCDTTVLVFDGSRLSRLRLRSRWRCGRRPDLRGNLRAHRGRGAQPVRATGISVHAHLRRDRGRQRRADADRGADELRHGGARPPLRSRAWPALPIDPVLPALVAGAGERGPGGAAGAAGRGQDHAGAAGPAGGGGLVAGRIVMLEPRRVAARAAAERLAEALGEPVGRRVGYRIRGEAVARERGSRS